MEIACELSLHELNLSELPISSGVARRSKVPPWKHHCRKLFRSFLGRSPKTIIMKKGLHPGEWGS